MIKFNNNTFFLETKNTGYYFSILPTKHLEHLYYGKKLGIDCDEGLKEHNVFPLGNTITYDSSHPDLFLENKCLEFSSLGKGDLRTPFVEIQFDDGNTTCDFLFSHFVINDGKENARTLPTSFGNDKEVQTLEIHLFDNNYNVELVLYYSVFENTDVIARRAKIINDTDETIKLDRLFSMQLDFDDSQFNFSTFHGRWASEMHKVERECLPGSIYECSRAGTSSSRINPFSMLSRKNSSEDFGEVYGFNLIYSGNHEQVAEVNAYDRLRISQGISSENFSFILSPSDCFESAESIMTFSNLGFNGMSQNMHNFINKHIIPQQWQNKARPVLLNNWEANYFNFNEEMLLHQAKLAKELGVELFVVDDGWFGHRNDDTSSLGDWTTDLNKLPNGLSNFVEKINEIGLDFGIWVEPEMISKDSQLFKQYPHFALTGTTKNHSLGRNQYILDLTQSEVRNYIKKAMVNVFESANISYVKWDMNRIFSDTFSHFLPKENQQEFSHRYVLGLYEILDFLTKKFPHILFEGCSAGGNRFDLGMLCYTPQIWASDNTDAICRCQIQTGYSYGYPVSAVTSHTSDVPNHQTEREVSLSTRLNVSAFGVFGLESNLTKMTEEEKCQIKDFIAWYKENRHALQFGKYYRILNGENGKYSWSVTSLDKNNAYSFLLTKEMQPNLHFEKLYTRGLSEDKTYSFTNLPAFRVEKGEHLLCEIENKTLKGSVSNNAGIKLSENFCGMGSHPSLRHFQDNSSRLYHFTSKP